MHDRAVADVRAALEAHGDAREHVDGAASLCESLPDGIDLLVTDIVMPGMSGPALAGKIREICRTAKVLYVSGYTDEGARGAAIPGGSEFLAKPFSADKVLQTVRRVLEEAA
jgi:two-component system cell cycle sensor histidine kinase/response regulator CckA